MKSRSRVSHVPVEGWLDHVGAVGFFESRNFALRFDLLVFPRHCLQLVQPLSGGLPSLQSSGVCSGELSNDEARISSFFITSWSGEGIRQN